jgi:hypothetical protein
MVSKILVGPLELGRILGVEANDNNSMLDSAFCNATGSGVSLQLALRSTRVTIERGRRCNLES